MERSQRGVPFEEAVRRWGDPELVAALPDVREPVIQRVKHRAAQRGRKLRKSRSDELFQKADRSLFVRLYDMQLFCSGRKLGSTHGDLRFLIHPERLHPDRTVFSRQDGALTCDQGTRMKRAYSDVEVFRYPEIPANISNIAPEIRELFYRMDAERAISASAISPEESEYAPAVSFRVQNNYAQVTLGGLEYTLSPMQAEVVRALHVALLEGDPWVHVNRLKEAVGSGSQTLSMLFRRQRNPDWKKLIKSDGRGYHRLRIAK